jgi:hypothetical protein
MITRSECRLCGKAMTDVLSLGDIVPVDFIAPGADVRPALPLTLAQCGECSLVQLRHMFDRDSLFRQYWYLSGLNPTMVDALRDVVEGVKARVALEAGDVVVDIGANDGTLLDLYDESLHKIGFDPALNLEQSAKASCDLFVNDYFETSDVDLPPAKVITSIAMFYDLDDPRAFLRRIVTSLRKDGIWVMQMTDLVRMLRANAFDNICHEHVCYYSLAVFANLVAEYGLRVFDVEFNDVNGASVRAYIGWNGAHEVNSRVAAALADEAAYLCEDDAIVAFAERVRTGKESLLRFLRSELAAGKVFHAMGASTKGNTLLQFYGLSRAQIHVAAEVSPAKFGLLMAGCDVPIVPQEESLARRPDYYLVLPWHFIDFLARKHEGYMAEGGALIVPLPAPAQYTRDGAQTAVRLLGSNLGDG